MKNDPSGRDEEEETLQTKPLVNQITPVVQRQVEPEQEEEEEEEVRAKAKGSGNATVSPTVAADIRALRGDGQPLPMSVRRHFEPRFSYDFSQVRLHTNKWAAGAACTLKAQAFTLGNDIVFGMGQYAPETLQGRHLLAHELTHVVQQRSCLQRQPAPSSPTTSSTGWSSLPGDAQRVLTASFNHYRRSGVWLWKYHASAQDCFDKNLKPVRQRAFRNVYDKLKQQQLWPYVQHVIEVWPESVQGVKFDRDPSKNLRTHLQSNTQFCRDTWSKNIPKWRQVVTAGTPGLHIIVPGSGPCEAHIDRISPISGRKPSGMCKRKLFPEGMHHLFHEKLGMSRSSLLLGGSGGVAMTSGGTPKGFGGLDIRYTYRFLSLLGNRLHVKGFLKGEASNLFVSGSAGMGLELKYGSLSGLVSGGGIIGKLTPRDYGEGYGKFGAGFTGGAGIFYSLDKIALLLGVEYDVMKNLVKENPTLHRLMLSAKIRIW